MRRKESCIGLSGSSVLLRTAGTNKEAKQNDTKTKLFKLAASVSVKNQRPMFFMVSHSQRS